MQYDNTLTPPPSAYNILKVGNENETALCNLIFETERLTKNNDDPNCHIYYTFNDGTDKWSKYVKLINEKEFEELKNGLSEKAFNAAWPVGITYVQYPKCDEPNKIFNHNMGFKCYWEELNFDGAFFRATGTGASQFGSGVQGESLPNDAFSLDGWVKGIIFTNQFYSSTGSIKVSGSADSTLHYGKSGTGGYSRQITISAAKNSKYFERNEVAPKNYTIRIWKRIS